jgi:hypothetical protein
MKLSGFAILLSLFLTVSSQAQPAWREFSPRDLSFKIELPPQLKHRHAEEPFGLHELFNGLSSETYDFSPPVSGTSAAVVVAKMSKPLRNSQFDKIADSGMLIIGGDDKTFSSMRSIPVNGKHAREYFYEKGSVRGRVVMVNAGRKIFFLQYHTEDGELPKFVTRLFSSFRVLK